MPVVTAAGACHTCTVGGPVSWERRGLLTHVLCCTGIRSLCEHRHEPPADIYRSPSLRYPASGPEAERRSGARPWVRGGLLHPAFMSPSIKAQAAFLCG